MQNVLSLYSCGKTTAIIIDIGHGNSVAVPVYDGFAVQYSIVKSNLAG